MKKSLKIWLIVWWSLLVVWWTWAWLTKTWVIPNWFWIEVLCSCVDCHWIVFYEWDYSQVNWRECCEWTYKIKNKEVYNTYIDWGSWIEINTHCLTDFTSDCFHYEKSIEGDYDGLLWQLIQPAYDDTFVPVAGKPIIYIYPTERTEINVKLWTPKNLLHTYPKYNFEKWWNIVAQPNGDLKDMDTWRKLYALYREWKSDNETNFDEWFVVEWKDIIPFLEEKLAILWLNEREAEEFIVYWLPQMENNKYNLIRFETEAEQDKSMPLNITPKPDTVIRVMMDWKAIDELIDIPEQKLTTPERNGFTVVEWWGSSRN